MQSPPSHTNCLKPSYRGHPPASPFHYCRDAHTLLVRSRQQTWNNDHEAQVTMMTTEGARGWTLSSNIFMAFSTVCPRDSGCQEMDRSAPLLFSPFWDQLRCCHLSVLLPNGGRFSRVLGSTCDTRLPLLGLPTQLHTLTVGHKTTRTQFDTVRAGCLNRP